MKEIEKRIEKDGIIIDNEILKVDSFINHQIDVKLLKRISSYIASQFDEEIDKILTIETSGIAFAIGVSECFGDVPVVFAKKSKSKTVDVNNLYTAKVKSFTRNTISDIIVDKRFLTKGEKILIIDDFLAEGNASIGLIDLCNQAGCEVRGIGVAVEKSFQGGRKRLEDMGYKVVSAANITGFVNNEAVFAK